MASSRFVSTFALIAALGGLIAVFPWRDPDGRAEFNEKARRKLDRFEKGTLKPKRRFDQPDKAVEYWNLKRKDSTGVVPAGRYAGIREHVKRMPGGELGAPMPARLSEVLGIGSGLEGGAGGGPIGIQLNDGRTPRVDPWVNLGPSNVGGRTRALLVQPGDVMFAAGIAGGVWKSVNGGSSWTPLTDFLSNLAVSTLAQSPTDADTIYAGTGEGYFNEDAVRGAGIFKTTDGGTTWSQLAATANANFRFVNKIVVSPNDSTRVYAATREGLFRSTDSGSSWAEEQDGNFLEMAVFDAGTTDTVLAWRAFDTVYRSTDDGDTFAASGTGITAGKFRGTLTFPASDRAYCAVAEGSGELVGFYESTDGGVNWTQKATLDATAQGRLNALLFSNVVFGADLDVNSDADCLPGNSPLSFNQGWYDNVIAAHPSNPNRIWLGGIDLWRSDDRGVTWGVASYWWKPPADSTYVHADHHAIAFHPSYDDGSTNATIYFGNDGGIARTTNGTAGVGTIAYNATAYCGVSNPQPAISFSTLNNGYGVTQFYHGDVSPSGNTIVGGTQDNGNVKAPASGTSWTTLFSGDGGYVAIDPGNESRIFFETQRLDVYRSDTGGTSPESKTSGITEAIGNFLFIPPFEIDPTNASRLWIGGRQVFRTVNSGDTWSAVSAADLTGASGASISAWGIAPGNGAIVYFGTQNGRLFRSLNALDATPTWTSIESGLPAAYISSLAVHPQNPARVFATFSSFGVSGGQLWTSANATVTPATSVTWAASIGTSPRNIPDVPVHSVFIHPADTTIMMVGTDTGVLGSGDSGANWATINGTTLPNVVVEHLDFRAPDQLYAFTHGRGVVRTSVEPPLVTLTDPNGGQRILPGSTVTVTWTVNSGASDFPSIASFEVLRSLNNGGTYESLRTGIAPGLRSFTWDVAGSDRSTTARVRVRALDGSGVQLDDDDSDGVFTINRVPSSNAGPDQFAAPSAVVTLDGRGSSDPDSDSLVYAWSGTPAPAPADAAQPTFTASGSRGTVHTQQLDVSDGFEVSVDTVTVTVNRLPIPDAGPDQRVPPSTLVTLDGRGSSDPDGSALSYDWTTTTGGLGFPKTGAQPTFTSPGTRGVTITIALAASDPVEPASDSMNVTVNSLPVAATGGDQRVLPSATVTLSGNLSTDPDLDALTYAWTQTGGTVVSLSSGTAANPTYTAPATRGATQTFNLVVDDGLETASAAAAVRVNQLPVATASGPSDVAPLATGVTLSGSGADADGDSLAYQWAQTAGTAVTLSDPAASSPTFTAPGVGGLLTFTLRVTDGLELSSLATVNVTVNTGPAANAGADRIVAPDAVVTLDGSGSSDPGGDPLTFTWTQLAGTAVTFTSNVSVTSFTATSTRGERFRFRLEVSDGTQSATDEVVIDVNQLPTADAGVDQRVRSGDSVTLDGRGSSDPESAVTYAWLQLAGGSVGALAGVAQPAFTAPSAGQVLEFRLTAGDGVESATDTVRVTVNAPPVSQAGANQVVLPGATVTLRGATSSDADGDALTYGWTQTDGTGVTLSSASAPEPTFTASSTRGDAVTFDLTVDDGLETATDSASVTVNRLPVAAAGADQRVLPGATVTLEGGSSADADGTALSYTWTQTAGDAVGALASVARPTFTASTTRGATATFDLSVGDGLETASDGVQVRVNRAPAASAGAAQRVTPTAVVTLNGAGSSDGDGDAITYSWTQTAGPAVSLSSGSAAQPTFSATAPRGSNLVFQLQVGDGLEQNTASTSARVNRLPVASVSAPANVPPGSLVTLDGSGSSDPDGDTITYEWTQTAGPAVSLAATAAPSFTAPSTVGTVLTFQLRTNDGLERSSAVAVSVRVGTPPVARVGADQRAAPGQTVTLDGSTSSDADGDPISYSWAVVSGPAVTFDSATAPRPAFTCPDQRGQRITFELTVTSGSDSSTARMAVDVNEAPVAAASASPASVVPGAPVTLDAQASADPDGGTLSFLWRQTAGPAVTFDTALARPAFNAPSARGQTLAFTVDVSDGTETVSRTVSVRTNQLPVAPAAELQVARANATVTLSGNGCTDADGDPIGFRWTQTSGPPVSFDTAARDPLLDLAGVPAGSVLTFTLEPLDGKEAGAAVPRTVRVNRAPVVEASVSRTATGGSAVSYRSTATDPDGDSFSVRWTQLGGTPVAFDPASPLLAFTAPSAAGALLFEQEVADGVEVTKGSVTFSVTAAAAPAPTTAPENKGSGGGGAAGCQARREESGSDPTLALMFVFALAVALRRRI